MEVKVNDDVNDDIEEPKVSLIDSKLMDHEYFDSTVFLRTLRLLQD